MILHENKMNKKFRTKFFRPRKNSFLRKSSLKIHEIHAGPSATGLSCQSVVRCIYP